MKVVNVHEAKTHLSRLLNRVQMGEEIVIAKSGKPVARLVPVEPVPGARQPGSAKGTMWMAPDFAAPLSDEVVADFEGES